MIASSATAGQPVSPSRAETSPSCICAPCGQPRLLGVLGDHPVERLDVLQRAAHQQRIGDAVAVVGEHPDPGRRVRHRRQLGQPLALAADGHRADRDARRPGRRRGRAGRPARRRRRCPRSGRCSASRRPRCSHREPLPPNRSRRSRRPPDRARAGGCAGRPARAARQARRRRRSRRRRRRVSRGRVGADRGDHPVGQQQVGGSSP